MAPQLSGALMSRVALPHATPVRVPMSVPGEAAVTQVSWPNGDGVVNFAPTERTVPFVVPAMFSMLRLPAASTTTGVSLQLLKVQMPRVMTIQGPLKVVVEPCVVDE